MIHIVDYGLGNVKAFISLYKRLGVETTHVKTAEDLKNAQKIILPGVGAFDHAMELLDSSGFRSQLETLVLTKKVPVLGVCVGMQILATTSDEGRLKGLGWIPGKVRAFANNEQSKKIPLPHMGWNDVTANSASDLFRGLETNARFYFLHSFYYECDDPSNVLAQASYGFDFCCSVSSSNIYGVQFHPEKSHSAGIKLLKNFSEL